MEHERRRDNNYVLRKSGFTWMQKGWREDQFTVCLRENYRKKLREVVANEGRFVEIPEGKGRV